MSVTRSSRRSSFTCCCRTPADSSRPGRRLVRSTYGAVVLWAIAPTWVQRVAVAAYAIMFVVLLIDRLRRLLPAERRTTMPVAVAAIGPIATFVLGEVLALVEPSRGWWEAHWWVDRITIFWAPAAMAFSLLGAEVGAD